MAIEALEQPERTEKRTETHACDLIDRQAAIDALGERPMVWVESDYELGARNQYDADVLALETLPSVERKKGEWLLVKGSNGKDYHKCSQCLHTQEITGVKNYCAVCGAEMRGEEE